MGPDRSHFSFSGGNPGDQRSLALFAIGVRPFSRHDTGILKNRRSQPPGTFAADREILGH
jgi:hypothetical protein